MRSGDKEGGGLDLMVFVERKTYWSYHWLTFCSNALPLFFSPSRKKKKRAAKGRRVVSIQHRLAIGRQVAIAMKIQFDSRDFFSMDITRTDRAVRVSPPPFHLSSI